MNADQVFERLVNNYCPPDWEQIDYSSSVAHCFDVGRNEEEYIRVIRPFLSSCTPTRLSRVQNPFKYGPYILRKEQMAKRYPGRDSYEDTVYHVIDEDHIQCAIETGCDSRKYGPRSKTPVLYESLQTAISTAQNDQAIIVVKRLRDSPHDICPMYVVYLP